MIKTTIVSVLIASASLVGCCRCKQSRTTPSSPFALVPPIPRVPYVAPTPVSDSIIVRGSGRRLVRAEIHGTFDRSPDIQMDADTFIVSFTPHRLRIEGRGLVLDGAELSPLPTAITNITVVVSNLTMTITGDGSQILTKSLSK